MSKYCFSVCSVDTRQAGVIESESFRAAVDALGKHVDVRAGDRLEIGVLGFPPAVFQCVGDAGVGYPMWVPWNEQAA
jgi:hypothetical protein